VNYSSSKERFVALGIGRQK